ncbi:MAG: thioredoxin family protein [Synergistaceae bacterium]|jgi:glutaredoxin|nr:thioredoxin family protein [Synergistaceae bacterium]
MKEVMMFMQPACPHCKKALSLMEEIRLGEPRYKDVAVKQIDETKDPDFAGKFDYYYVPTFFVGDEKLHEGVPSKEAVEKVFAAALA